MKLTIFRDAGLIYKRSSMTIWGAWRLCYRGEQAQPNGCGENIIVDVGLECKMTS